MTDSDEDDSTVVRRVQAGDNDAFARLVDKYSQAIHTRMRNYARDPQVCEELAQDVFVEAFLSIGTYRGDSPFFNWLSRIATFTGYRHWKKRGKKRNEVEFSEERDWIAAGPEPETEKDPGQAKRLACDMLATLPDKDRLVLTLSYLEECSHDEIAERLGWRKSLIAMRLFKAKAKLRKLAESEPWKGKVRWMIQ